MKVIPCTFRAEAFVLTLLATTVPLAFAAAQAADTAQGEAEQQAREEAQEPPTWHTTLEGKPLNHNYGIRTTVTVIEDPVQFMIRWQPFYTGVEAPIEVYRRTEVAKPWGEPIASLPYATNQFVDDDESLESGVRYEYKIKCGTQDRNTAYTYLAVGVNIPMVEQRGKVILLADETMAEGLTPEIDRLKRDLFGDGWQVVQHNVPRDMSQGMPHTPGNYMKGVAATEGDPADVLKVKELIVKEYQADPEQVKAVVLLGRVPQPYSGDRAFDTHKEHQGARPTDAYYADVDGEWTDETVDFNFVWKIRDQEYDSRNRNHPGDSRFDQSELPSDVELQVGRIDLWGFEESRPTGPQPLSELELLRQYLDKNHNFRHNTLDVQRKGLISDGYNTPGFCTTLTGWMGFTAVLGSKQVSGFHQQPGETWINDLKDHSYLLGLACGYGTYHGVSDVGSKYGKDGPGTDGTGRFIQWDPKVVFLFMSGSWFSDYDQPANFLRAPLASKSYCLTNAWSATPVWFIHHMALGDTIGQASLLSHNQDNNEESGYRHFYLFQPRGITSQLLGDPTLRLHPVTPPSEVVGQAEGEQIQISWKASDDATRGYHVYRAESEFGPFTRLTLTPVKVAEFADPQPPASPAYYMVRAVKLESSGSGSYVNLSQGAFSPAVSSRRAD